MHQNANGINMLDVKKRNRSAILKLVFQNKSISRKEIAVTLGLTPAAITLIMTDLINEGLISESYVEQSSNKKGRKEIMLEMNNRKFAAVGVYISKSKFRVICIDLNSKILFEDVVHTADCHKNSAKILDKLCAITQEHLISYDVLRTHTLLGIGVSVNGIVNTHEGISINSYGIWEKNASITSYIQSKLDIPVLLTNNICAMAHGESFLSNMTHPDNLLFIKYGPGVGAARLFYRYSMSVFDFKSIELGHTIADPHGLPCVCGSQGCLETIASYDAIEKSIIGLFSEVQTPALYQLLDGNIENISMDAVMEAFSKQDVPIKITLERVCHYFALAIKNAINLLDPSIVVLYGELFENPDFRKCLSTNLKQFSDTDKVIFSHYNLQLEALGPASTIINYFLENGGQLK